MQASWRRRRLAAAAAAAAAALNAECSASHPVEGQPIVGAQRVGGDVQGGSGAGVAHFS